MAEMGRPTDYTPEITKKICDRLSQGDSLRKICLEDEMPVQSTVFLWLSKYEDFSKQYAQARVSQMEAMAEETLEIADDGTNDFVTKTNKQGEEYEAFDFEHVQRSKLRVDTRKWLMSKMAPKKWGELKTLQHQGPDGGPIKSEVTERGAQVGVWLDKLDPETRKKVLDAAESSDPDK